MKAQESYQNTGKRHEDVFMGLDVWGRGTYGYIINNTSGGGLNSYKALKVAKDNKVNIATFAQACMMLNNFLGTYERRSSEEYLKLDSQFWYGISNHDVTGVSKYVEERSRPSQLYFYSDFNQGYGKAFWINGSMISPGSWHHIGLQSITTSNRSNNHFFESAVYWETCFDFAYNGGSCIKVIGISDFRTFAPLFTLSMDISKNYIISKYTDKYRCSCDISFRKYWNLLEI